MIALPKSRLGWALVTAVLAMLLAAVAWASTRPGPEASETSVSVKLDAPLELIDATSGDELVDYRATGQSAEMINAAMPFDRAGLDAARPFGRPSGLDYRRAQLCLTQAIYYEAGFEPRAGRRAVAQVVLNRVRHAAFPNSVCGVVYQGARQPVCQFSFTCDGSLDRRPVAWAWKEAEQIAAEALAGTVEKSVGTATHYHADYVAPKWAPMLTKVEKLGAHIFYRWPGNWGRGAAFGSRYIGEPNDPAALRPEHYLGKADASELAEDEVATPEPTGPPIRRAENDLGGYLDTSTGWTLDIPAPQETQSLSRSVMAGQAPTQVVAGGADALPGGGQ